jgi:hypothetical protein
MPSRAAETRRLCAVLHPNDEPIVWPYRRLQRGDMLETVFGRRWRDEGSFIS